MQSNNNIIWITGGQPKKNDKINIQKFKKKIKKVYIIGNHTSFFAKQIKNKVKYEITNNLTTTIRKIFKFLVRKKKINILFSPASASYDQYSNFVERGEKFKKLIKFYAKKFN